MARFMLGKGASPKVTAGPDNELLADLASNRDDQSLLDLLLSFGAEVGADCEIDDEIDQTANAIATGEVAIDERGRISDDRPTFER